MSEQRRRGRVTLSREPDHRAVHSDIIRAMPSCSQSTNSGDNNRSCRPSQFLAVWNRPSPSVVHACPCSHALRAHARCTVTQVNMRDVPLHADRVREGNAARSSCTYTMRSFRGVHGNLCVPANICRTGCSKARHGPSMPVRGPTRVQHQMWQKWNNETWFILFWVVKGRGGPCDRSRRHACPCIGPASSLSIAIFTRAISLAFSNRIATVINQPWRGLHLALNASPVPEKKIFHPRGTRASALDLGGGGMGGEREQERRKTEIGSP